VRTHTEDIYVTHRASFDIYIYGDNEDNTFNANLE